MSDLLFEKRGRYAIFTMNRPERLNALGGQMQEDLEAALDDFNSDSDCWVGILTGTGRAFSAGADLKEMAERNAGFRSQQRRAGGIGNTFPFSRNPKPFIAAVNGLAIGGGMERAMDCDIRIASEEAYFGLFEVQRGILAGYGIYHLARLVPFGEAMYVLLTADRISPQEAHRIGFIHEVVPPDRLMPRAIEIAEKICANAPLAVRASKTIAHYWRQLQIDEHYRFGQWAGRLALDSEDAREGPRAFAEKRAPQWRAR